MFSRSSHCVQEIKRGLGYLAFAVTVSFIAAAPAAAYSEAQFRAVTTENEAQINEIREQEINQIKVVMGRRFSESRRPDILLRLAELYIERYRFFFFKENEIHQAQLKSGLRPKRVDHTRSRAALKSAENACLSILKSKVPFAKMDQVYYFLAYNAQELGKQNEALRYFETIVKRYPRSQYAAETYRNLGEAEFGKKNYKKSVQYYEKAVRYTELESYPRTLYKLAWSYFKTRDKTRALAAMKQVVARSQEDDKFIALKEEALNDLVMFYAEAGRAKEAHEYFSQVKGGPELYVKALNRLATLYGTQGRHEMSLYINEELIRIYQDDRPDLVFEALGKNVEIYKKQGKTSKEQTALERLVAHIEKNGDAVSKSEDALATTIRVRGYLRSRASEVHKIARNKKSKEHYAQAASLYGLFIKAFGRVAESEKEKNDLNQVRIYRADCLLAASREDAALEELEIALNETGESKLKREAGATALNLLLKRLDRGKSDSESEKRFERLAESFEDKFPKDPLVSEIRYKRARLAARKSGSEGLSSDARDALNELIEKYPNRPESLLAAQDLVDDLRKRKEDDEASELAGKLLANSALMATDQKRELKKYLEAIVARRRFERVQNLEGNQNHESAAREYESLATQNKNNSEVYFKSLNNAAINYEKAGLSAEARRVFLKLHREFNKSNVGRTGLKRLGDTLLYEAKLSEAGAAYRELSEINSFTASEQASFGELAATIYWDLKDHGNSYILMQKLQRDHCSGKVNPSMAAKCRNWEFMQGELLLDAGKHQDALSQFRKIADSKARFGSRRAESAYRAAMIYERFAERSKSNAMLEKAAGIATGGKEPWQARERNYAARSAFQLIEPVFGTFDSIKLELPEAKLKANTKRKLSELERLVVRYNQIVARGDGEWGMAALERLGRAFYDFSRELDQAPVPTTLTPDQQTQYRREIQSIAGPMAQKARESFVQAHALGVRLKIVTETFDRVRVTLGYFAPTKTPPAQYFRSDTSSESYLGLQFLGREIEDFGARLKANAKDASAWIAFGLKAMNDGHTRLAHAFFEQAVSLAGKSHQTAAIGWNNLAVFAAVNNELAQAQAAFEKAVDLADLNETIQLNFGKFLIYYGQYARGGALLNKLKARLGDTFSEEAEIARLVAQLGQGELRAAKIALEKKSAKSSDSPTLWYNWSVASILSGDTDDQNDGRELLKERRNQLPKDLQWIADGLIGYRK